MLPILMLHLCSSHILQATVQPARPKQSFPIHERIYIKDLCRGRKISFANMPNVRALLKQANFQAYCEKKWPDISQEILETTRSPKKIPLTAWKLVSKYNSISISNHTFKLSYVDHKK